MGTFGSLSAACGSGSRSSGATPVSGPPPPPASSTPAGQPTAINRLQMQLHLRGLQNSTNDLRSQLQQLRKLQVPPPLRPPRYCSLLSLPCLPHHPFLQGPAGLCLITGALLPAHGQQDKQGRGFASQDSISQEERFHDAPGGPGFPVLWPLLSFPNLMAY